MHALRLALIAVIAACRDAPPPTPTSLGDYLATLAGSDETTRARAVAGWQLDRATWERTMVPTYAGLHAEYARAFEGAAPALAAQLATRAAITTRPHYAGDPELTLGQARARWALPVQYPSQIAELDGRALDAVFIKVGDHWRAVIGLDGVLRARAAAIDPACAVHLGARTPSSKECRDVSWVIADATLRSDRPRFDHACLLASNLCAN